jgi:hypothetical protein
LASGAQGNWSLVWWGQEIDEKGMVMIQNILDRKGGEVITVRATETVKATV